MSEAAEETTPGSETSADALRPLLRRLKRAAPVVGWVCGMGVGLLAYQGGDLLDAALRGGVVWTLALLGWTFGLTFCERLLAPEADETSGKTPGRP